MSKNSLFDDFTEGFESLKETIIEPIMSIGSETLNSIMEQISSKPSFIDGAEQQAEKLTERVEDIQEIDISASNMSAIESCKTFNAYDVLNEEQRKDLIQKSVNTLAEKNGATPCKVEFCDLEGKDSEYDAKNGVIKIDQSLLEDGRGYDALQEVLYNSNLNDLYSEINKQIDKVKDSDLLSSEQKNKYLKDLEEKKTQLETVLEEPYESLKPSSVKVRQKTFEDMKMLGVVMPDEFDKYAFLEYESYNLNTKQMATEFKEKYDIDGKDVEAAINNKINYDLAKQEVENAMPNTVVNQETTEYNVGRFNVNLESTTFGIYQKHTDPTTGEATVEAKGTAWDATITDKEGNSIDVYIKNGQCFIGNCQSANGSPLTSNEISELTSAATQMVSAYQQQTGQTVSHMNMDTLVEGVNPDKVQSAMVNGIDDHIMIASNPFELADEIKDNQISFNGHQMEANNQFYAGYLLATTEKPDPNALAGDPEQSQGYIEAFLNDLQQNNGILSEGFKIKDFLQALSQQGIDIAQLQQQLQVQDPKEVLQNLMQACEDIDVSDMNSITDAIAGMAEDGVGAIIGGDQLDTIIAEGQEQTQQSSIGIITKPKETSFEKS